MSVLERGTAVEIDGRGLLILGASGSGKSTLALDLIAFGGRLIADDLVRIERRGDLLILSATERGSGLIEAREIGLLRTPVAAPTALSLVLDLDEREEARLPQLREWARDGVVVPMIRRPNALRASAIRAAVLSDGPIDPDTPVNG